MVQELNTTITVHYLLLNHHDHWSVPMSMRPLSKMLNIRLSCSMYTPPIADVTSLGAVCLCVNSCSEHLGVRHVGRLFSPPTLCISSFSFLLKNFLCSCPPLIIIYSKQSLPSFMWTSDKRGGGSTLSIQTARLGLSRDLIFYPPSPHTSHHPPARPSIERYSYLVLLWVPIIQSKHRTWSVCLFIADDICSRLWRAMVQTFDRY